MNHRNASSTSIGTSVSTGQTNFFNSEETWSPYGQTPAMMIWGANMLQDPKGNEYMVRNEKNKKALDNYYSTNMTAVGVNAKLTQLKKVAITKLMEDIGKKDIIELSRTLSSTMMIT